MGDLNAVARWDSLRVALAMRYANAAEAYVALGGRAGGEISLLQLERSLQDLNAKVLGLRRGATPKQSVDVHGILSDVESNFKSGLNFQQFAAALMWEDKKAEVIRTKEISASRILVGAPGSALRTSRENESPGFIRAGAAGSAKRPGSPAHRSSVGNPATQPPGETHRDARSLVFPDWKGKKWTGSKAPPAHIMQDQRRKVALHAAVSQDKNTKMLKTVNTNTKIEMDAIEAAEAKLKMLVQMDVAHKARQSHGPLLQQHKEPLDYGGSPNQSSLHPAPSAHPQSPTDSTFVQPNKAESMQSASNAMSSKAAELSERLASLNTSVFQQKLSLAETEKNILLKERQELQAQIRQMNHLQKQSALDMQNKMTDQFGNAMKETFEEIKDVIKTLQGTEKKDIISLNEAFEKKIRKELLHLAQGAENANVNLVQKRSELYGPLNLDLHNFFDSVISVRAETEGERVGNGFFFHLYDAVQKLRPEMKQSKDHVDAGNPHSTKAPFLLAIINSVQYNPVLSWYTVDSQDVPNAGSVGRLARLDPINGVDYVDDFLLEMLLAIRLNQIFPAGADPQSKHSILGTILPIFIGGEHPMRFSRNYPMFPREKLHLLSNKPSIETMRTAAALLHSVGVSTPEHFLRLSIREVVGKIMDFPGIWMDKYESKQDAQSEAAKMIVGLSRAEVAALVAKNAENIPTQKDAHLEEPGAEISLLGYNTAGFGSTAFEGDDSEDEDDLTRQQKHTMRDQMKAMEEERHKRALKRRLEEHEEIVALEKKKKDCLAHFERCFRELGFDAQAKNLGVQALNHRDIVLREIVALQQAGNGDKDQEEAQKRKLEKAMRKMARSTTSLKKSCFEGWVTDYTNIKNFRAKMSCRSDLKKIYFEKMAEFASNFRETHEICDKKFKKKNMALLRDVWYAWRELQEEETEKQKDKGEAENTTDPAHLALLLRKLEAAVVETHQKHSLLLEMTHNEEIMSSLFQKLSSAACDTLRDAGITKLEHLVHLTMGENKAGPYSNVKLQSYGVKDPNDLKRIEMFLINPDSFELGGLAQPAGDFDQKREQLLDDMSSLREKLDLKKSKLMAEFPDEPGQNQANQNSENIKDPNLGVLNELLGALGVQHHEPTEQEDEGEASDLTGNEEVSLPGEREQAARDRETKRYIAKLKNEGSANQSVLQALAHSLGEVGENLNEKEVVDDDTLKAKMDFTEKIDSMQKTMEIFVKAVTRARELLDNDDVAEEQEKSSGKSTLVKPEIFDRAEELALGNHTIAELEAQKLAADVDRRSKQADALEKENMQLKEQLQSLRARPPDSKSGKSAAPGTNSVAIRKQHWSTKIADPELAQKYSPLPDEGDTFGDASLLVGVDDDSVSSLEARWIDPALVQSLLLNDDTPWNFGYSLEGVDNTTPFTRSSLFESLLDDKIQRGRAALQGHMDITQVELDEVQKDISDVLELVKQFRTKQEELQQKSAKSYRPNPKQLQEQVLGNDREWREAEDRLKSLTNRESEIKGSLLRLKSQFNALDLRKELEGMDRKMAHNVAAATEELKGLMDAEELDPTPEISACIADARDKVQRIEESWKLKRNMRIKEIEIELLGQKMAEDEVLLRNDVAKFKGVYNSNASDVRDDLSRALQMMEDSVTNTARGRCRPEVLKSMPAVQKLRGAISRHKLALETEQMAERKKLLDQQQAEKEKRETEERKRAEEEDMKKLRATGDLVHREKRLRDITEALQKKKSEMFAEAGLLLQDAKNAFEGKSDFSQMYITKSDRSRRHARSFVADAKALYQELNTSIDPATEEAARTELETRQKEMLDLEENLNESEKVLTDMIKDKALTQLDALLKKDLRKMSETLSGEMSDLRKMMSSLLPSLDVLSTVEDNARVKSRTLATAEEKLRHGWARLAPKLDDALSNELSVSDKSLDVVQAALASGKLSTAHKELLKAEEAFKKVQSAKQ